MRYPRRRAHLVPTVAGVNTTRGETVLQGCTALGHRRAFARAVHPVAGVTVSGL